MNTFLNRVKISYKLILSLVLTLVIFVYLAVQLTFVMRNLDKQNEVFESGIVFSDAVFEAKYFLRSDMHILYELMFAQDIKSFDYWWGEHVFQIQFFNDQIKKIENNTRLTNDKIFKEYVSEILKETRKIKNKYTNDFIPLFGEIRNRKLEVFTLLNTSKEISIADNGQNTGLYSRMLETNQKVSTKGISMITSLDVVKNNAHYIVKISKEATKQKIRNTYFQIIIVISIGIILSVLFTMFMSKVISGPVFKIRELVDKLALGLLPEKLKLKVHDEIGDIANSLNKLIDGLQKTSEFSSKIGSGSLEEDYEPLSEQDVLGNSLLEMRSGLLKAKNENELRREEDEKQNWTTEGLSIFGDVLRKYNQNFKDLSFHVMSKLVEYLKVIQGAMFVLNDENEKDIFYELTCAIAYNRDKLMTKHIKPGQGLVGRAAHEKMTINLTEIPEDYISINSGLGNENPNSIIIVPLMLNETVLGVIELASFKDFEQYQIDFLEQLGEDIASIISSVKVNVKTAKLLEESQHQSEELAAQEEEMRQNMEELQATQEEAARREEEMTSLWGALNQSSIIVELDMRGTILNLNERNAELTGMSKEQMIGKNHREFAIEALNKPEWYKKFWDDLQNGIVRERLFEVKMRDKNLWIHETYTPIRDASDEFVKVLNIGNDITAYKLKELELQEKLDKIEGENLSDSSDK